MLTTRTLLYSFLALGVFFILGIGTSFAAANDYAVSGGAPASLPNAGDASISLSIITISDTDGDDFTNEPENISIDIRAAYPNVAFDTTVAAAQLTIAGSCGFNGSNAITYSGTYNQTVTIPITGPGAPETCAAGQTITINGLKVVSLYKAAAPGVNAVIQVDNDTTADGSPIASSSTVNFASDSGDLSSTNVEPAGLVNSSTNNATVSFTTTAALRQAGKIVITFPTGFNVASVNGTTASSLSGLDGTWNATVAGQVVTLTQVGGSTAIAGAKSLVISNVQNPVTPGTTGTYTILTEIAAGDDIETSTATGDAIAGTSTSHTFHSIENVVVADHAEGGLILTWDDPTSDDSTDIQILRGVDPLPVSGTAYAYVDIGVEYYIDTDLEAGDIVTYQLRPYADGETGSLTEEVTFTVGSGDTVSIDDTTEEDTPEDTTDDVTEDTSDVEEPVEDTEEETEDEVITFSDIAGHWGENAVEAMVEAGVVEGYEDGTFDPNGNLNRAEAATLLWRVVMGGGAPTEEANEAPFEDVAVGEWYTDYISELKEIDLIEGNPDGTYEPAEEINRAEFLQLAVNVWEYLDHTDEGYDYDVDTVLSEAYEDMDSSEWYSATVAWATVAGFVSGSACDEGTCFNAGDSITRAEATQILYNMFADML